VFDCEVLVADCSDAAAIGAALRAEHGLACRKCVLLVFIMGMVGAGGVLFGLIESGWGMGVTW
jgi:hypothetical protein